MDINIMTQAVLDMKHTIGKIEANTTSIKEKVDAHDELLKQHSSLLVEINNRTFNLDSWKNGIIHTVAEEKEKALAKIREEIKPLQDEFNSKVKTEVEVEKIKAKTETWKLVVTSVVSILTAILASIGIKLTIN